MHSGCHSLLMVFGFLSVHLTACVLAVCPPFSLMAQCTWTRPRNSPSQNQDLAIPPKRKERDPSTRKKRTQQPLNENRREPQARGHFGFGHLTSLLVLIFQLCPYYCHRESCHRVAQTLNPPLFLLFLFCGWYSGGGPKIREMSIPRQERSCNIWEAFLEEGNTSHPMVRWKQNWPSLCPVNNQGSRWKRET